MMGGFHLRNNIECSPTGFNSAGSNLHRDTSYKCIGTYFRH